jgi:integrase
MSPNSKLETIKFLTVDEITRLLTVISNKRDKAILLIAYQHGLRASEIGLLQIRDLDFQKQRIMIHWLKGSLSPAFTHCNRMKSGF